MFHIKSKHTFYAQQFFVRKSGRLRDNVEKYDRDGEATDDYIIGFMPIAWRITKATNTHSEYAILIAIPRQPCLHERHQCYFIRTLPVLIMLSPHLWPPRYLCDHDVFVFIACSSYLMHHTLSTVNTDLAALVPKWHVRDDKYPTELNFHADKISLQITRQQRRNWGREIPNDKTSGEAYARG
jgi:hypothetical protein